MSRPRRFRSFRLPRRLGQALLFVVVLVLLGALRQWRPELFPEAAPSAIEPAP